MHSSSSFYPKIVDKSSAILGLPDSRETAIPLNADHESVCRFACEDDEGYKHVSTLIVDLASSATQVGREHSPLETCSSTATSFVVSSLAPETPDQGFCRLVEARSFGELLTSVLSVLVPYSQNNGFIDRKPIIQKLRDCIDRTGKFHSRVALWGLGGVG